MVRVIARWLTAGVLAMLLLGTFAASGYSGAGRVHRSLANYQTYYCGTSSSWCTLVDYQPNSTNSTALRDDNFISCSSGCYTHVYYYGASLGGFDVAHTYGATGTCYCGSSGGNYVYSRCITDSGFGSYSARCSTDWHT